jgi:hypothetical protein
LKCGGWKRPASSREAALRSVSSTAKAVVELQRHAGAGVVDVHREGIDDEEQQHRIAPELQQFLPAHGAQAAQPHADVLSAEIALHATPLMP